MVSFQVRRIYGVVGFLVLCLLAIPAFGELSQPLKEWGSGPAQWIMTPDEQRAWRKITTDTEANNFIDLFWVRRDPSRGTAANEFHEEFDNRVAFSDKTFKERKKRGAMSDRGRVYIVLGAASNMAGGMRQTNAQRGIAGAGSDNDPSGGRQLGEKDIWIWEQKDARKFEMGRIEVVFIEDATTRSKRRDPQRTDFGLANTVAIRKAIVNPDLTSVPVWAPAGGLRPLLSLSIATLTGASSTAPPAPSASPAPANVAVNPPDEGPAVASNAPGASKLTLLASGAVDSRSADPFAVVSETTLRAGGDALWAAQYCSAKAEVPQLKFMLAITGPLGGASAEQMTKQKDAKAERMPAQPGCYVLQGILPVSKLAAGRYKLMVLLDEPSTGDAFTLRREFQVQ
jgi:GWxTD domain-containing protein